MLRATAIVRKLAVKTDRVADTITLDHQDRHRRRMAMKADGGLDFLLDLDKASVLEDGDAVRLEDGRLVRVAAKEEDLIEITASSELRLMKLAWHLGNRHVPAEVTNTAIYIAPDHVLVEMVRGLGAKAENVKRPFRPERGAYHEHGGHDHSHDHHHEQHVDTDTCGCRHEH